MTNFEYAIQIHKMCGIVRVCLAFLMKLFRISSYLSMLVRAIYWWFDSGVLGYEESYVPAVYSANRTFDNSLDPTIFGVCCNVRIETIENESTIAFVKALDFAALMSINTLVVSGSVVRYFVRLRDPRFLEQSRNQTFQELALYEEIVKTHGKPFKYYFDIGGNSDLFSVWSYDSPEKYCYNHCNESLDGTSSVPHVHFFETPEFAFIMLNPFTFPLQQDLLRKVDNEIVDMFEKGLTKFANRDVFVFMHSPLFTLRDNQGDARPLHRFKDILDKSNAHMVVTGYGAKHAIPQHYGRALEIMASDNGLGQTMGFVTLDNGCAVFHTVNLNNELPRGFITNPIPFEQIAKKSVFNEENLTIRVIALTQDDSVQTDVNIDGKHLGSLNFERLIRPNTSLWTFSTRLSKGKHSLRLTGFVSESMEFYIADRRYSYFEEKRESLGSSLYRFVVTLVSFCVPWFIWHALEWAVEKLMARNEVCESLPARIISTLSGTHHDTVNVSIPLWISKEMCA